MGKKDPRVDAYIGKSAAFAKPILKHLRKIVHEGCPAVEETIKWQFPHFDYKGIMCAMAGFNGHCTFGFWKGSIIFGRNQKGEDAMGHFGRVTSIDDLPSVKVLVNYVRQAAKLNDAGMKVPSRADSEPKKTLVVPKDLQAAFRKNAKARKTFASFSPSNKKDYVEWITGAKREETRKQRLKTAIQWMNEGKVHNWRYLK
jgi:uncharacterized protein YdeI (YjbR/CyaY-like superfamily)